MSCQLHQRVQHPASAASSGPRPPRQSIEPTGARAVPLNTGQAGAIAIAIAIACRENCGAPEGWKVIAAACFLRPLPWRSLSNSLLQALMASATKRRNRSGRRAPRGL